MAVDIRYFASYVDYYSDDDPYQRTESIEVIMLTDQSLVNRIGDIVGSGNWSLKFLDAEQRLVAEAFHLQGSRDRVHTFAAEPIIIPKTMTIGQLAAAILAAKDTHCLFSRVRVITSAKYNPPIYP